MKTVFALITFVATLAMAAPVPKDAVGVKFPTKLVCKHGKRGSESILYTRLQKITDVSKLPGADDSLTVWESEDPDAEEPKKDEIAKEWVGESYSATIDKESFRYSLWTCDTEDRWYVFKTNDLHIPAISKDTTKKVAGKLTISVREDEETFDLACEAHY